MAILPTSTNYIAEWMTSVGLKQADLVKVLGWSKAKSSAIWNREQRVNEDQLKDVAPLVHAEPYELLMPPPRAHRLRQLEAILSAGAPETPPPAAPAADAAKVTPMRRKKAG